MAHGLDTSTQICLGEDLGESFRRTSVGVGIGARDPSVRQIKMSGMLGDLAFRVWFTNLFTVTC